MRAAVVWDPDQYNRYANERGRPFGELVRRIGATAPSRVVDLGCGTGALTAGLLERWPGASVQGVDSSPQMLQVAARHARPPRLTFEFGDARTWRPQCPVDVLVSNAMLQWVPDHLDLLPGLVEALAPDGWLAFGVPGNFDSPTHTLLDGLCRSARWRDALRSVAARPATFAPAVYLDHLSRLGCTVDAWETTYLHVLPGEDPVLEWMRGTALRPVLEALGPDDAARFEAEYAALLREAYPSRPYGTVLPFRRVFVVAHR
jgi:trans-aconitate 2-methyltransferase